jgi:hypothetical protein
VVKTLAIVTMAILLQGCATSRTIQVPVSCVTVQPEREPSVFDALPRDADVYASVHALLIDRDITEIYIGGLEAIVAGCR